MFAQNSSVCDQKSQLISTVQGVRNTVSSLKHFLKSVLKYSFEVVFSVLIKH